MYQHPAHQESISRKAVFCAPDSRKFLGHPVLLAKEEQKRRATCRIETCNMYTRNSSHYEYAPAVIEKMIIKRVIRLYVKSQDPFKCPSN